MWILGGLLLAGDLAGQTIDSPYEFIEGRHEVGVLAGYLADNRGALGIGPGSGPILGARYGLELSGPLAFEGGAFLMESERDVFEPVPDVGLVPLGTTDMTVVGVDARLRFTLTGNRTWHGLAPYASAGAGIMSQFAGQNPPEEEGLGPEDRFDFGPTFMGVLAAGTRWIPGDRIEVRAEGDLWMWQVDMPAGFRKVQEELGSLSGDDWVGVGSLVFVVSYRL